jgi:hypothetical protein
MVTISSDVNVFLRTASSSASIAMFNPILFLNLKQSTTVRAGVVILTETPSIITFCTPILKDVAKMDNSY